MPLMMNIKHKNRFLFSLMLWLLLFTLTPNVYAQTQLNIKAFEIIGDNPIGKEAYKVIKRFLGKQGIDGLSKASETLEKTIKQMGYGFHRVNLPPQTLSDGIVKLEVIAFKVGEINFKGNKHFDEDNILNSLKQLRVGSTPNTTDMSRAVKFANNHPDKKVSVEFKKGQLNNQIESTVHVIDHSPSLTFLAIENSGSIDTEAIRATLAYQHSNLFNKDHHLVANFTTAPLDINTTSQYELRYKMPVYSRLGEFSILLSQSESNAGQLSDDTLITGRGSLLGVEYTEQLNSIDLFDHKFTFGLSHKLYDNEIFGNNRQVLSLPVKVGYQFAHTRPNNVIKGALNVFVNLPSGDFNDDDSYELARTGASKTWWTAQYYLQWNYNFISKWQLSTELSGQVSPHVLIPGEQLGLGGFRTLKGFEENSLSGDEGVRVRIEGLSPVSGVKNSRLALFYDVASIKRNQSTASLNDGFKAKLASAGFGVRWTFKNNINLNVDIASILKGGGTDSSINQTGDSKLHFSMVYRF